MFTVSGNLVNITFSKPLDPGNRYNLVFHADAAYNDQAKEFDVVAPLFVPQPQGTAVTISPASRLDMNNGDYILVFSEPIGVGFGATAPIGCVVFYEADLDGNPNLTSPGEWNSGGNNTLKCDPAFSQQYSGLFLRPDEPIIGVNQTPITGFTSQWRLSVKNVCAPMYQCSTASRSVHLVFSRNPDPQAVVKRSNGAVVPDLTPFALPSF